MPFSFHPPGPKQPVSCFLSALISLFWTLHPNGIIYYVVICDRLLLLIQVCSRSLHLGQYLLETGHIYSSAGFCAEMPDTGGRELGRGEKSVRPKETREGFMEAVALTRWYDLDV